MKPIKHNTPTVQCLISMRERILCEFCGKRNDFPENSNIYFSALRLPAKYAVTALMKTFKHIIGDLDTLLEKLIAIRASRAENIESDTSGQGEVSP